MLINMKNYHLIFEIIASQVIAVYTFWLTHPYEVDVDNFDNIVTQTLKSRESYEKSKV